MAERIMTCGELIEYLQRFAPEEQVGVVVVDIGKRLHHITKGYQLLAAPPAILLETTGSEPMDEILEEVPNEGRNGSEDGQLCGSADVSEQGVENTVGTI